MSVRPSVVVIGAGWAGFYICEHISTTKFDVTIIAPRRTSAFTPLLASAAVGLFNFYLAEEPVRSKSRPNIRYLKANVTKVDLNTQVCHCAPAFEEDPVLADTRFDVPYDILIIAPGCQPNTFGTPGVADHALFMKNVSDAMAVRKLLFDLLEKASLPHLSRERVRELLHIAIVGGGPTGIEMTAELDDLCKNELKDMYPSVASELSIGIYDVAANILGAYDKTLYEYANTQLVRRNIRVRTNTHIERVDDTTIYLKNQQGGAQEQVPYGMLIWATGNKNVPLVDELSVRKTTKGLRRIITDAYLHVYKSAESDEVFPNVFALGDAADIDGASLPTTAEVAVQKAKYLVQTLNTGATFDSTTPYKWQQKGLVSYLGSHDGIMMGDKSGTSGWTGRRAWLAWRTGSVMWTRSWRNRLGILLTWALNALFGKEIAKI